MVLNTFRTFCAVFAAVIAFSGTPTFAQDIVLGASVQLTGPVANTGRYYKDAYEFAIDKINAAGGVKVGNTKRKLVLKLYDNQSDVNLSVRQYTQLVSQDKVNFLLGPFASNFALADFSGLREVQDPDGAGRGRLRPDLLAQVQIHLRYAGAGQPLFRFHGRHAQGIQPGAEDRRAALCRRCVRRVGRGGHAAAAPESCGLKIVIDERYSTNATDFNSLLSQIKSVNVDAVLVAGHETEILNFVRQAKSLAVAPKMYSFTVGVPSEDFRKALGKDADYAFGMTAWLPSASLKDRWFGDAEQFATAYKAKFGYDPDYHAASGVADVEALAQAIEDAGSIDPQKVRDALAKLNFDEPLRHNRIRREWPDRPAADRHPGPGR